MRGWQAPVFPSGCRFMAHLFLRHQSHPQGMREKTKSKYRVSSMSPQPVLMRFALRICLYVPSRVFFLWEMFCRSCPCNRPPVSVKPSASCKERERERKRLPRLQHKEAIEAFCLTGDICFLQASQQWATCCRYEIWQLSESYCSSKGRPSLWLRMMGKDSCVLVVGV